MVMTIAEDMKKLTENIMSSCDVRVKALGDLVVDTRKTLKGFASDRKKMGEEQAKDLADFAAGLSKDVRNLLKEAQNLVNEFHKNNRQMGKDQAKSLSDFVSRLASDVGSMLSSIEKDRGRMSKDLKGKLVKEIKDIQTEVKRILNEADKLVGEYSSEMAHAKKAWKDMSTTLAKLRKSGVIPRIEAREKVTTVHRMPYGIGQAKGCCKKKGVKKSKGSRQTVGV